MLAKKHAKNRTNLPRTAGLRTISEMAESLTAAGLDPSRLQERAAMLAKARGAKRKRDGEGMDVDADGDMSGDDDTFGDEAGMEVDGEESTARKRAQASTGAVVTSTRAARVRTNRMRAGMADEVQASKAVRLRNLGQRMRNMHAKAGESDRAIRVKMPKHLYSGKRKGGKTDRR